MDPVVIIVVSVLVVALLVTWLLVARRHRGAGVARAPTPRGLGPALSVLGSTLRSVLRSGLDEEAWDRLEEALLAADVGVESTRRVVETLRSRRPETAEQAREALAHALTAELGERDRELRLEGSPAVVLVVGVNGTGKTTTIAKLAHRLQAEGRSVLLAAADTFRAGAAAQLRVWAERLGVELVSGQEGGDPAAVVHDALAAARGRGIDVVIVDTAGRLHAKRNLMAELGKIHRVAAGERGRVDESLLVLDATSGQNGVAQVREFAATLPLTGMVLTKLDGTAKGGIVVAVEHQLGVPVKFVGVGEGITDLLSFNPDTFVSELLEQR